MATDNAGSVEKTGMTAAEVTAYVKKELDEDVERTHQYASNAGVVPTESATGITLDLSHKYIHALPVEVIGLIKDRVERYAYTRWAAGALADSEQARTFSQPSDLRAESNRAVRSPAISQYTMESALSLPGVGG